MPWNNNALLIHLDTAVANWTFTGAGIGVAHLDSGINFAHPSFAKCADPVAAHDAHGWNFIDNNADTQDRFGHGTMTAGVLAAPQFVDTGHKPQYAGDGLLHEGIAPACRVIPLKVFNAQGQADGYAVKKALAWILQRRTALNIHVVTMSFNSFNVAVDYLQPELSALEAAGVVLVAATGNQEAGKSAIGDYMGNPAKSPSVIAVGSADADGRVSACTYRSATAPALLAPTPGMVYPSMDGPGPATYVRWEPAATSCAAPQVAGCAALLKQMNPAFTPAQIRRFMIDSAMPVGDAQSDNHYRLLNVDGAIKLASAAMSGATPAPVTRKFHLEVEGFAPLDGTLRTN